MTLYMPGDIVNSFIIIYLDPLATSNLNILCNEDLFRLSFSTRAYKLEFF